MTPAQAAVINAGVDATLNEIKQDEMQLGPMFQGYVDRGVASAAGRQMILRLVTRIIAATDAKRAEQARKG